MLWLTPILVILIINFSGCLQMRDSDRKISKKLAKKNLTPAFHDYTKNKHTIHYWDLLNGDKPVIMFVHGSPGSSTALMGIATDTAIAHNFTPVLVDRPGFGYSNFGKAEKSLAKQAELLVDVLKTYSSGKKILVGHSLGGPIIAKMAMDYPDEIDAIIILAGSVDPNLEPKEWHRKPMSSKWVRWMIPDAFNASNDEILTTKAELEKMLPDWEKLKIPITVIQGTKDGFVPKENADFVSKMAKNAAVKLRMLKGDSHFFPFTKPEIVIEELLLFK